MRFLEFAFLLYGGRRKRSFAMAEQFSLNQVFRDRRTVYFHEHLIFPQALCVDGVGYQFLSSAGFAVHKNPAIGRRHELNLLPQRLHRDTLAYDDASRCELLLEVAVFQAKTLRVNRVLQQDKGFVDGEGLLQKVICPQLSGADRGLNRPVPGNHDDFGSILSLPNFLQGLQPVHSGQPDIQ